MADNGKDPKIEDEDDEDLETPGYKAPEKKTLEEIQQADQDDESLKRYKEQLLGNLPKGDVDDGDPRNVVVEKMAFCSEGREDVELDLTGDISKLKDKPIVVKEGCEYRIKIIFKVKREIVSGLQLHQAIHRMGARLDKDKLMVGSYGPKVESQTYTSKNLDIPKGMISRGSYKVKSKFTDDDKNDYLSWEWAIDIKKDWE